MQSTQAQKFIRGGAGRCQLQTIIGGGNPRWPSRARVRDRKIFQRPGIYKGHRNSK